MYSAPVPIPNTSLVRTDTWLAAVSAKVVTFPFVPRVKTNPKREVGDTSAFYPSLISWIV